MYVYIALGYGVANSRSRIGDWAKAAETAVRHARAADIFWGDTFGVTTALMWGPTPADEALHTLDALGVAASSGLARSYLLGALGRFDEAWALLHAAAERYEQAGDYIHLGSLADLAALAGDYETAVRYGEQHVEAFTSAGHLALAASYGGKLGRWLCLAGRPDEAEPLVDLARPGKGIEFLWRQVSARILAHRGEHGQAETLAREAVAILEPLDLLTWQGDSYLDLADVLAAAEHTDAATEAYRQALERYERKQNLAMVAQARQRLDYVMQPQRPMA
jgi:tetratricopeptide (TPR) repeat protein